MSVIDELIRQDAHGTLSFGNYLEVTKRKVPSFEMDGDIYKLKTYKEITKLEKNGKMLFESVPGSAVHNFSLNDKSVSFKVCGFEDTQITMELSEEAEYKVFIDNINIGKVKTNLSGKLTFSAELKGDPVEIKIERI